MANKISRRNFLKTSAAVAVGASVVGGLTGCSNDDATVDGTAAINELDAAGLPNPAYDSVTAFEGGELEISEHVECDVVVMGSGSAGCLSAISAVENGAKNVVIVEKAANIGGNTRNAGSVLSLGCQAQKDAGYTNKAIDEYVEEAATWHEYNFDRVMVRKFLENTGANIDWIMGLGVPMDLADNLDWLAGYHVGDQCMGYTGDAFSGSNAINVYEKIMPEMGIDVRTSTPGVQLAMEDGACVGLICKQEDGTYIQFDSSSVIIAAGAYGNNNKLIRELTGRDTNRMQYCGIKEATGDGFYMAQAVGGYSTGVNTLGSQTARVKGEELTSDVNIIGAMQPWQIWLNQEGVRFTPEFAWYPQLFNALFQQFRTYSIIDSKILGMAVDSGHFPVGFADFVPNGTECPNLMENLTAAVEDEEKPWIVKADTIEELAELLGIDDPAQAVKTVENYNSNVEAGADSEMGKAPDFLMTLDTAPYYGFQLNGNLTNARGGIRADINMRVMDQEGYAIPGLYAAGLDLEGFESQTYDFALTGSEQAIAIFSGRIAGEQAAKQL